MAVLAAASFSAVNADKSCVAFALEDNDVCHGARKQDAVLLNFTVGGSPCGGGRIACSHLRGRLMTAAAKLLQPLHEANRTRSFPRSLQVLRPAAHLPPAPILRLCCRAQVAAAASGTDERPRCDSSRGRSVVHPRATAGGQSGLHMCVRLLSPPRAAKPARTHEARTHVYTCDMTEG